MFVNDSTGELTLLFGYFDVPHTPHQRFYGVATAPSAAGPWTRRGVLPPTLRPPRHCARNKSSAWYRCYCNNEDPFLYRAPDGTWRLLFHQYTLLHAPNNKSDVCMAMGDPAAEPDPSQAVVGGYARSLTADVLGEWEYDYWRGAYGMQPSWAGTGNAAHVPGPKVLRRERPKLAPMHRWQCVAVETQLMFSSPASHVDMVIRHSRGYYYVLTGGDQVSMSIFCVKI